MDILQSSLVTHVTYFFLYSRCLNFGRRLYFTSCVISFFLNFGKISLTERKDSKHFLKKYCNIKHTENDFPCNIASASWKWLSETYLESQLWIWWYLGNLTDNDSDFSNGYRAAEKIHWRIESWNKNEPITNYISVYAGLYQQPVKPPYQWGAKHFTVAYVSLNGLDLYDSQIFQNFTPSAQFCPTQECM